MLLKRILSYSKNKLLQISEGVSSSVSHSVLLGDKKGGGGTSPSYLLTENDDFLITEDNTYILSK